MVKKLIAVAASTAMLLPMIFNTYAFAEDSLSDTEVYVNDNADSYTVVVTNDDFDDDWISKVNFNYDLIWTISGDTVSCKSSDGSVHFDAEIIDDTLYVDGTDFLFAICEIPNITNEEDEGCLAMLDWVMKLHDVKEIDFFNIENLEMLGTSVFFTNVEKIYFGDSLERIGENNIGIPNLRKLEFPKTLKEIGSNAFRNCIHLEQITIPKNVEKIGEDAFYGCSELKDITVIPKDIELNNSGIGYSRSGELLSDVVIRGYSGSTAESYANENNFEFVDITPEILGTGQCGENVYWTLYSDGTLDLEGTGATYDYTLDHSVITEPEGWKHYEVSSEYGYPTWFDLDLDFWDFAITTINVGEGITRLGDLIFVTNLIYYAEEINLPDSLEEIGFFALSLDTNSYYEPNVINKFPKNLRVIEDGAFYSIYFDDKIILPESVEKIGSFAFNTSAKEYVIPQNVKEISPLAFGFTGNEDYVDNYPIYDEVNEEYLEQFFKFRWAAMCQKDISHVTDVFKADTGVTVYGYMDTAAETYANENNFEFVPLNEETTTTTSAISTSTETTTTVVENTTTETSSEIASQNTASSMSGTTTAASTTSKKSSAKEDSPKTGDKRIIGIGAVFLSALGMFCISKKRQ